MFNERKLNKEKIALMTKLAIYDKHEGKKDRKKLRYFRHDYIYRQNMRTRFFVFVSCLIMLAFYILHRFSPSSSNPVTDLYTVDYGAEGFKLLLFYFAACGIFTVIGTLKATAEYEAAHSRLELYLRLLKKLDGESPEKDKPGKVKRSDGNKSIFFKKKRAKGEVDNV